MPEILGQNAQTMKLYATVLRRDPNRRYTPQQIEDSNMLLRAFCDSKDTDVRKAKEIERRLWNEYRARIDDQGCVSDSEGGHGLLSVVSPKLLKFLGR